MNEKLTELLERFQNGELTAEQAAALEELLRAHPEARAEFVSQCLLEMQLYKAAALAPFSDSREEKTKVPELQVGSLLTSSASETLPLTRRAVFSRNVGLLVAGLAAAILIAVVWWKQQPAPLSPTPTVIARIGESAGQVGIVDGVGEVRLAAPGQEILRGEKVQTQGDGSWASLSLTDGTKLELGADSVVSFPDPERQKNGNVDLEQGAVQVHAAQQPQDRPLVFSTAHARVIVLGTKFRLYKEESASRVELEEGKVRLVRKIDGREVEVKEGSGAVAAARVDAQPLKSELLSREVARLRFALSRAASKVALSPGGAVLAGNHHGHWKTWSVADGKPLKAKSGLNDARFGLVYSLTGDALLSLSDAKHFAITDPETWGRKQWPLMERDGSRDGAISSDGRWMAVGQVERKMHVWSISGDSIKPHARFETKNNPTRVALSRELATGFPRLAYAQWSGPVEVLDLAAAPPRPVRQVTLTKGAVVLALADDGQFLATCSLPDGLQLWQVDSGAKKDLWSSQAARLECLRFSADGKFLAAGFNDGTARIWSTSDGEPRLVLDGGCRIVRDVIFSADGAVTATAGDNGQVKVWDCSLHAGLRN